MNTVGFSVKIAFVAAFIAAIGLGKHHDQPREAMVIVDRIVDGHFAVLLIHPSAIESSEHKRETEWVLPISSPFLSRLGQDVSEGTVGYIRNGRFIPDDVKSKRVRERVENKMMRLRSRTMP